MEPVLFNLFRFYRLKQGRFFRVLAINYEMQGTEEISISTEHHSSLSIG